MKKTFLYLLLIACAANGYAQVKFDALQFSPAYPKKGDKVTFTFNAETSPLIDAKKVDIAVYYFGDAKIKVAEPAITQKGKTYSGSFVISDDAAALGFLFEAGKLKDNNSGKGFLVPVYNSNNQPVKEYYAAAGRVYGNYGEYFFDMNSDPAKNLSSLEEGMKAYPESKNDIAWYGNYLAVRNSINKKEAEPVIRETLTSLAAKPVLTEAEYNFLSRWYNTYKMKPVADSFTNIMKTKYPDGKWKINEVVNKFYSSKEAAKKKEAIEHYKMVMVPNTAAEKEAMDATVASMNGGLASAYAAEKNWDAFYALTKDMKAPARASLYNNLAWNMAEKDDQMAEAKKMSMEATTWAKKEITAPAGKQPESSTKKQWAEQRRNNYAMYGDTYAFILHKTGQYQEGLKYAKEATAIKEFKDAQYNERYTSLLVKAAPTPASRLVIEKLVKDGAASTKTKEDLKTLYVKEKGSDKGFDAYLAKLETTAKVNKEKEVAKTMINEKAPAFTLKDFDGKEVSLASLQGKVVIVDFWATWCGPCIASMPAMQKAQEKLKARGDVEFLFVDTWENVENKKQNAMDFMKKNNYPFHVLMDDESEVVANFKVSGIPTKFILDKKGNIRFKAIGFSGNDDALVDEVSTMVELASK